MAKSRSFSIYLLKRGFDPEKSLKENHALELLDEVDSNIPEGGKMYIGQSPDKSPWWKEYWGIGRQIKLTSVGAIVFLHAKERWFAITFGTCYHNLKEISYEYDFGLRTTLNTLDPEKVKSTDLLLPATAKRQRIQIPEASNLTFFDFDRDESIVRRLTGAVKEEYRDLFRNATGASSLKFSTKCEPSGLIDLCSRLLEIYERQDYKEAFPDIHNIIPVKDPYLIGLLNDELLKAFEQESKYLTLCIPDIVDYSANFKVDYRVAHKRSKEFDDVYIGNYREFLHEIQVSIEGVSVFDKHSLSVLDEDSRPRVAYSIFQSFLYDCQLNGKSYHLCEGNWYEINNDYISRLKSELDPVFIDSHDILSDCNEKRENEYNKTVAENPRGNVEVHCLDMTSIAPKGQRPVEPCDLIANRDSEVELMHNKISTRSASLSHLFNQGVNSVMLLLDNQEAKDILIKISDASESMEKKIVGGQYAVTFGIISNKPRELKSDALPLFSRISLLRSVRTLKRMRIPVKVFLVKDNVDRKHLEVTNC